MTQLFSWQAAEWNQLFEAKEANRMPHALLFVGMAGIGKVAFAETFSQALLCKQLIDRKPCGECHECRLVAGNAHPDLLRVVPEKEGQAIKIDQIRAISEFVQCTGLRSEKRVVLIHPADSMNLNASNALLKTLEEPSSGAILILVSNHPEQLPATILSRCQRIIFPKPARETALAWLTTKLLGENVDPAFLLELAEGAPLAALLLHEDDMLDARKSLYEALSTVRQKGADPIKIAASLSIESLPFLDGMLSFVMDIVKVHLGGNIVNQDFQSSITTLSEQMPLAESVKWMDYLLKYRQQVNGGFNFNKQLLIESIFVRWMNAENSLGAVACS